MQIDLAAANGHWNFKKIYGLQVLDPASCCAKTREALYSRCGSYETFFMRWRGNKALGPADDFLLKFPLSPWRSKVYPILSRAACSVQLAACGVQPTALQGVLVAVKSIRS